MNKKSKDKIILFIIICALIQSIVIYQAKERNKSTPCISQNSIKSYKTLSEFNNELNCLENMSIVGANENNGKWYIKLKLEGSKEDILNGLLNLKKYSINNYIINHNNDENIVIVEITDNKRV